MNARLPPFPALTSAAIVHEDERLVVVAKPAGEPTQPARDRGRSLIDRVADYLGTNAGLVHRLDVPVSGLVVFGKTPEATAWLSTALQQRRVHRGYLAIVRTDHAPPCTTITEPLRKAKDGRAEIHPTGKPAHTSSVTLATDARLALLAIRLHTGRTHQARAHLAWGVGAIVGDRRYGDIVSASRIGLHAALLRLPASASTGPTTLMLPPPDDFWAMCAPTNFEQVDWQSPLVQLLDR